MQKKNDSNEFVSKFNPNSNISDYNNIISKSNEKSNFSLNLEVELKKAKAQENIERDKCMRLVSILNLYKNQGWNLPSLRKG